MKFSQGLAAIVLMTSAAVASAEITGTVTATSDYDFRGISLSAKDPALQASIDYAHDSGFYLGIWGSNVDYGDCCDENLEIDYYAGFAGGEDLYWDVGIVYYTYPGANYRPGGKTLDYAELYGALGYKWIEGKIWYANSNSNSELASWYYEANGTFELPANFGLTAHIGYSDGDYFDGSEYTDWSIGLTYMLGHFEFALKWVDGSDLEDLDDFCKVDPGFDPACRDRDVFSTDARAIFSVSTTFPWSNE